MEDTSRWEKRDSLIYILIFTFGLFLRFYLLSDRAIHHDESLHGMYSLYYLENPGQHFYKYDPLLHGPLLYHTVPWFFFFFGISKFALRLPAVLLGSILMFLPLILRKFTSKSTLFFSLIIIAISPTMVYWSRFIRHDGFVLLGIIICLFSALHIQGVFKGIFFGLGLALQFCAKENSYLHFSFLLVYLFYEGTILLAINSSESSLLQKLLSYIARSPLGFLLGLVTFCFVYAHYYSAGFIYWDGVWDGAFRKSLVYWFKQHQMERISGPFSYSFLINSFFESWWLPALLLHLYVFYKRQTFLLKIGFLGAFLFSGITHFMMEDPFIKEVTSNILKLKIPLDYYLFFPLIFHAVAVTTTNIIDHKKLRAFTGFLFFSSLFTYSFVGEKVPWLALYPCLTGLIFFSFEFDRTFNKPILIILVLLVGHTGFNSWWANFKMAGAAENLLSQVHTSQEFERTMTDIRSQMESHDNGKGPYFLARKGQTWPTTWYLHGRKEYHFHDNLNPVPFYRYILSKPQDDLLNGKFSENFHKEVIPLRHWWVPDYKKMSPKNLWNYFFKKNNWNPTGAENVGLWINTTNPQ